ncbi:MAG TPA: ATPase domain-containing protein [Bryobacteraceae bacterium]|nr:ATPase domain-containing protein [Bryobacteraceae bacterium]
MSDQVNKKIKTGISGLDDLLQGGLPEHRLYLIEGSPGTGKTTLALQFLLEGRRLGERCLYVTLSENKEELRCVAESHGWSLDGIDLYELEANQSRLQPEQDYTVFHPEEVELAETIRHVCDHVERIRPGRVVFDSLSEMRMLARNPLRYRRQILTLKQFFSGRECTVLLLDDTVSREAELQLQSISHGVLSLERLGQEYGVSRRRVNIVKLRGTKFRDGYHDYTIDTGGIQVFPRLVAADHRQDHTRSMASSGIEELDLLLGGGLSGGTSTLITGPAGSGKSSLSGTYLLAAARRGQRGKAYIFEETRQMFLDRMAGLGMDLTEYVSSGQIAIQQVDPAELSPGEFTHGLREDVERDRVDLLVVDSLQGYLNAMPNERFLLVQLHEVLAYLAESGVLTIMVAAQHGMIGPMQSTLDISYLADTVILLRFFESGGALKKAISVVKHRLTAHEKTIREFELTPHGLRFGPVLREFRGVLTGVPEYLGNTESLLDPEQ